MLKQGAVVSAAPRRGLTGVALKSSPQAKSASWDASLMASFAQKATSLMKMILFAFRAACLSACTGSPCSSQAVRTLRPSQAQPSSQQF